MLRAGGELGIQMQGLRVQRQGGEQQVVGFRDRARRLMAEGRAHFQLFEMLARHGFSSLPMPKLNRRSRRCQPGFCVEAPFRVISPAS